MIGSWGFSTLSVAAWFDDWLADMLIEIERTHRAFLDELFPRRLEPNPLPILMRATNSVALRFPIKQPRWRSGRWRSTT